MKFVISVSITLPVQQSQAFAYVTDWDRQRAWIPATRITYKHNADGVNGMVVARTSVLGIGFNDSMQITTYDSPQLCVVRHAGKMVRGEGQFIVESWGAQSKFTWLEDVSQTVWWYRYLFILSRPISFSLLILSLHRLRRTIMRASKYRNGESPETD